MPLFQNLLSLHAGKKPEEDFFTEIFVSVLSRNQELLHVFLKRFLDISEIYKDYSVESQVSFSALPGHGCGSRLDVVIKLFPDDNGPYDVVFIESKIGSVEGDRQLERYTNQLESERFTNARHRNLLYMTHYHDPKPCKQARWSDFYELLKPFRSDNLVDEAAIFMEENCMTEYKELTRNDLYALKAFPKLAQFMLNSLDDEIKEKFTKVVCKRALGPTEMIHQLRANRCLVLSTNPTDDWWVGIGYFWQGDDGDPYLGLNIEVDATSENWEKIVKALKEITSNLPDAEFRWEGYDLDRKRSDAGIWIMESLISSGLSTIEQIRSRFALYLDQVELIKKAYPSLPWKSMK